MVVFKEMNIFILIYLCFSRRPIGSHPNTWKIYKSHINKTSRTFTCFDNSNVINLSQINDNIIDCDDGSDEPGTPIFQKGTFYCRNEGSEPKEIPKTSVSDGICDCCDGSDEFYNRDNVECPITCGKVKFTREQLIDILTYKYEKGIGRRQELNKWGNKFFVERTRYRNFYKKALEKYDLFLVYLREHVSNSTDDEINTTKNIDSQINNNSNKEIDKKFQEKQKSQFWKNIDLINNVETNFKQNKKNPPFINFLYKLHQLTFHPIKSNLVFSRIFKRAFVTDMINMRHILLDPYIVNKEMIEAAIATDNESLAQMGEIFNKDDYWIEFMGDITLDEIPVASYKRRVNDALIYEGEKCVNSDKNVTFKLRLICYSGNKLLNVVQLNECEYDGLLATPLTCTEQKVKRLKEFDYKELKKLYRLLEIRRTSV